MLNPAPRDCPLCGAPGPHISIVRRNLPVLQNVVHPSRAMAREAPAARFELGTCRGCGFSFNAVFDPDRMIYDVAYDNHVESAAFRRYYRDVAGMLLDRFEIIDGTVYDIGCGKGEFLRILCELAPGVTGIGIDPSCTPCIEGNFELRRSTFEESDVAGDARLVILRHVLEHIDRPASFLMALRAAMPAAPLYVEVPDVDWILDNRAFWDFCYEHCNYFSLDTLRFAMAGASFEVIGQDRAFGGQYQWAIGMPGKPPGQLESDGERAIAAVTAYAGNEADAIARLRDSAGREHGVAIWGMATKGVLLAILLGAENVVGGVDMNAGKQGRFAAGSGVSINSPDWLRTLAPRTRVLVMNPNYLAEIRATDRKSVV